jgi:hypothetical protein
MLHMWSIADSPGERFHLPGLADPGDCYECSAALRDSERLFKLHPEADL